MKSFVILDRDGVINEDSPDYIKTPDEWIPIAGSLDAIATMTSAGVDVFVATNQAGIARGKLTADSLSAIHQKMQDAVVKAGGELKGICHCPHHPNDNCDCRKPKPGMLRNLAETHGLELSAGYYVGDSLKDLRAAEAAGCTGVLVLTGNGRETLRLRPNHQPVHDSLLQFAQWLIRTN